MSMDIIFDLGLLFSLPNNLITVNIFQFIKNRKIG